MLGEPVYLAVSLANSGTEPESLHQLLLPDDGFLAVRVLDAGGEQVGFVPLSVNDGSAGPEPLAAGEAIGKIFPIHFGGRSWTFRRAGAYTVHASYRDPSWSSGTRLRSEPAELTVAQGDGEGQRLLDGGEEGREAALFMLWRRGRHLTAGRQVLQGLVERSPESPLADYANLALGSALTSLSEDPQEGPRARRWNRALDYLDRVRAETLPDYLRIHLSVAQARCQIGLGRRAQARQRLAEARQVAGDRVPYRPIQGLIDRVEGRIDQETPPLP